MEEKQNIKYFNLFKKYLYVIFCISFFFYTAFKVSLWNNVLIAYYLEKIYYVLTFLKTYILIPLLFIFELITVFYKLKSKTLANDYLFKFVLFFSLYLMMKKYAYYWRFEELIILIYFARYLEFNKIMYIYVSISVLSLVLNAWGCIKGYLEIDGEGRGLVWGFSHSNQAALTYAMLFIGIAYCLKRNKSLTTIISIPVIYLIHYVFRSRTPFYVIMMFLVLLWLEPLYIKIKATKYLRKIINIIYILFPILMIILAVCLGIMISHGLLNIDANASIRFREFVLAYQERGLATYYRDLLDSNRHYFFDNGYAQLLFKHGLVSFCSIYLIWILNSYKIVKDSNYLAMIVNISLFVYMMMEFVILNDLIMVMMTYYMSKDVECDGQIKKCFLII